MTRPAKVASVLHRPLLLALGLLSLAACDDVEPRPFAPGQGQDPNASGVRYPSGPYGVEIGSVIGNYTFRGMVNPSASTTFVEMQLADFYNPTGDELFLADSVYGERPKPTALWINISAVWCGPCQFESEEILPEEHAKFAPQGAELMVLLADGATVGKPATENNLLTWTSSYGTAWPAVIDPTYKLASLFQSSAYPINIVIDTATMQIAAVGTGLPSKESEFFVALEDVLAQ
jgi:hypothetical protein